MRRLIIIVVEDGKDPEVDWEGPFAYYELIAAMNRAQDMLEESRFQQEAEESDKDEEEDE